GDISLLVEMIKFEINRLLKRRTSLFLGIVLLVALFTGVVEYLGISIPKRTIFDVFSFSTSSIMSLLLAPVAGFFTGGALVADSRSGLLSLIFSRGVSAFEYVTSKVITSALGQMCFIGITLVVFFVALLPFFPMGTIYIGAQRYSEAFAYDEPVTYCFLIALLFMAAAVAFNGIALLTSVWVKNTFVVMAAPTLLYMGLTYVMRMGPTKVNLLDPYANLALTDVSIPVSILHMVCYWAVIALVTHVLAIAAFSLKKDYM
ncbi:MAG TPA: hypothetical protein PLG00_04525, partial [Coprothermobacter proteolyticus]|nr:hypothetical protein [Coprothermobacter proteolyticus]